MAGRLEKLAQILEPGLVARAGSNPHILGEVAQNLDALEVLNPALAARVRSQEPAAIAEAYESLFRYSKPLESSRGRRQLREVSPALADDLDTADHPQIIRAAEALARRDAFIPTDSLTISEGARMAGKFDALEQGIRGVARGADNAPDVRRLIGELIGTDAVDFTNPEVMRLLPLNLQRGVLAGDTQAITFATQHVLRSGNQRGRAAVDALGGAVPPRAPAEPAALDLGTSSADVVGPPGASTRQNPGRVGRSPHQNYIGAGSMDMRSPTQMPRSADLMPEEGLRPVAASGVDPDFADFTQRQARTPDVMEPDFDPAPTIFDDSRAMYGPPAQGGMDLSGPGVPVGEPYTTRFADRASLGLADDAAMRPGGTDPAPTVFDDPALEDFLQTMDPSFAPPRRPPPMAPPTPRFNLIDGPPRRPPPAGMPPRRPPPGSPGAGRPIAVGAALGLGAGLGVHHAINSTRLGDGEPGTMDGSMDTADLAAETSPPPSVVTEEPAPMSPRDQAQELMRDLNLRRRAARGEVPEAPAMMREIDRLMGMSNQTMAAASRGEVATGGDHPHMQAARLMAQRNEMLRRGMPTQQAQQMMAEITRLQRLGDEQRNARQAPRSR